MAFRKGLPARTREQLLVLLVRELGVGDRQPAPEVVASDSGKATVGLAVDPRHKEARDRMNSGRFAVNGDETLKSAEVSLGHLPVAVEREDQRDVDRISPGRHLLDCRNARV